MCCDGWSEADLIMGGEPNIRGTCPDCGADTIDGTASYGCNYSPVECETCGAAPCDLSC